MELQLKHLAPYLPYELKATDTDASNEWMGIKTIIGLHSDTVILLLNNFPYMVKFHITKIRPLLKPLYSFEYDHIVQIKEHLGLEQWCDYYDEYFDAWFDDAENVQKLVLQCPYEIMQFFLECHFDVFGLLDAGLAIEIKD